MPRKALRAIALSLTVGLAVGFAAASWIDRDPSAAAPAAAGPPAFNRSQPLEERVRALEQAVSDERYARQLLQDELLYLTAELEELDSRNPEFANPAAAATAVVRNDEPGSSRRSRESYDRVAHLEQGGFTRSEAEWIVQRESELQMAALQARYDAGQSGDMASFYTSRGAVDGALRDELGDAGYERYRAANGRSTSVAVGTVIDSSPAHRAGLLPGDRITRYGGERVFGMSDLLRQTLQGQPGQQVVVDIVRDGVPMQVVMPRGPLGISGGRRYGGN